MLALADVLAAAIVLALLLVIFPLAEFNSAMLGQRAVHRRGQQGRAASMSATSWCSSKSTLDEVADCCCRSPGCSRSIVWLMHDGLGAVRPRGAKPVVWSVGQRRSARSFLMRRSLARDPAGRASSSERCLVVGDDGAIDTVARKLSGQPRQGRRSSRAFR